MVGYLRGATATQKPLADLVSMLPALPGVVATKTELIRFDRRINVLAAPDMKRLQTEAGYLCPAADPRCDAQESHLDQALARIAGADANGLSVIVSDLWLTNSEVQTTEGVALARPLNDIFASGRGVAVYGFESPYSGRVYDLPSGSTGVTATRRYLFVVAAGPPARLDAFRAAMARAPSASIQNDLASGRAHYALFTTEPVKATADGTQAFELPGGGALARGAFLPVRAGVRIPQFTLDRSAALRAGDAAPGARWQGVAPASIRRGAVWEGESAGSTGLFRMSGQACLADGGDWRADGQFTGGWQGKDFTLRPGDLATLASGTYLLVGDVRRTSLQSPNSVTQWLRDWSFAPPGEDAAVRRPVMPTLNLAEVARLMENALAQAAESRPIRVGGFAAAVQIK
ncbi:hypothetical protein [Sphingomonas sp. NPDC079357]|uniref:hypothetical protein n=1 Tax=Sphingomonas sp. NPDC079357 TaxID=3364518 RepID=UPI00384CA598